MIVVNQLVYLLVLQSGLSLYHKALMLRKAGIFLAGGGVVGGLLYFGAQRALQSAQQMISDQMQVRVVEALSITRICALFVSSFHRSHPRHRQFLCGVPPAPLCPLHLVRPASVRTSLSSPLIPPPSPTPRTRRRGN